MNGGIGGRDNFSAGFGGLIAALTATVLVGISMLPVGAQAEVVTPHVVKPQVVKPEVLTPSGTASQAPEPAPVTAPSEPPVASTASAPGPSAAEDPAPPPRSPGIQIPNRGRLPVGLDECTSQCHQRKQAEALVYVMALVQRNQFFAGLDPVNLIAEKIVLGYSVEHPSPPGPEPQAIEVAANTVQAMLEDAAAGASKLLEELLFAEN